MTPKRKRLTRTAQYLAALAGFALLTMLATAGAEAKPTRINQGDGQGLRAQPATLAGWQVKDSTGTLQKPLVTGLKGSLDGPGAIQWSQVA